MQKRKIGFFVTCIVDIAKPQVAIACISIFKKLDLDFEVPKLQTCCGQISYNSGDILTSKKVARQVVDTFIDYDYIVTPSSSCCGIIKYHYPKLFFDDKEMLKKVTKLADKTFEFSQFVNIFETKYDQVAKQINNNYQQIIPNDSNKAEIDYCFVESCSSLRELKNVNIAYKLLAKHSYLKKIPLPKAEVCCGFGGLFSVKNPEISNQMVLEKSNSIISTKAINVISQDFGCLLNIEGKLRAMKNKDIKVFHIAQALNGEIFEESLCYD